MEKFYCFAGVEIVVQIPDEQMYEDERRLAPFAVTTVNDPHIFHFEMVDALVPPVGHMIAAEPGYRVYKEDEWTVRYIGAVQESWEPAYIRAEHRGKEHRIQLQKDKFSGRVGTRTVLSSVAAEHLIAENDGFVFHCSYIAHDGKAILFTAPSGTGKSTQAEQWKQHRHAEIINGDRAAVRVVNETIIAEGIPFSGSSQYCKKRSLPLGAIVYLGQAPQTTIRKMRGYEAFSRIWEGCSVNIWDKQDVAKVSNVVRQITELIPVFHMPCTPNESAVIALEQELRKLVSV